MPRRVRSFDVKEGKVKRGIWLNGAVLLCQRNCSAKILDCFLESEREMIFNTFGNLENPVVIMLAGSFCPSESLEIIYNDLKSDYYIVAPTLMAAMETARHLL